MDISKLDKLKLYCPNEDTSYKSPDKMVDSQGNRLYAYVTLIMMGDSYIPGAITLAQSLINLNSQADKVVLVTPDVSDEGKKILNKFFDRVIEVNYVNIRNWRTKIQTQRKYLELVFTKFHLFNLTQYKKVILIDADALVLKHPDHIFTLNAPAGCFIVKKEYFVYYDQSGNYVNPPDTGIEWYNKYCSQFPHGKLIPKKFTDDLYKNFTNNGVAGGLMLLEPKVGEFDDILRDVSKGKMKFLLEHRFVWPEQQYLTLRYSGKWTSVNPRFFGLQGYPDWTVLFGLQYGGDKPFILQSKIDINCRIQYRDYHIFHEIYRKILKQNPELKESKVLADANEMNKYFPEIASLKRFEKYHVDPEFISKIYRLDKNKISKENLDFYHTHYNRFYIPHNVEPMFDKIDEYDYMQPIKNLFEITKASYYSDLIKSYNIIKTKSRLDDHDKIHPIDKDEIILQYVKSRPKTFILTLWNHAQPVSNEFVDFLNKHGNVYYVKKIHLSYEGIFNLLLHLYDGYSYKDLNEYMEKKIQWMRASKLEMNTITVIVFDNIKNLKIGGQASEFKTVLRDFILDKLKEKDLYRDDIQGNDLLHINDHYYQTIEYAGLYFNSNSLKLLENFNSKNYYSNYFSGSHLKFNTLRKWMYLNLDTENINRLCIIGSIDLYVYGVRNLGDIDGIFISTPDKPQEAETIESLNIGLFDPKTKINFIDIGIKNSKYWKQSWEDKNQKVLDYFGIKTFDDVVFNPKNHMYFHGVKMYLIDHELVRKIHRLDRKNYKSDALEYFIKQSGKDYTDFIMMYFYARKLLGHYAYLDKNNKFRINDDFKIEQFNLKNYEEFQRKEFISTILANLKRYSKDESNKINEKLIRDLF